MIDAVLIQNLAEHPKRLEACVNSYADSGLRWGPVIRVDALNGLDLAPREYEPHHWGCWMSAIRVFETIVAGPWQRVAVLADDMRFLPELGERWKAVAEALPEWDILLLWGHHFGTFSEVAPLWRRVDDNQTYRALVITREAAARVLGEIRKGPPRHRHTIAHEMGRLYRGERTLAPWPWFCEHVEDLYHSYAVRVHVLRGQGQEITSGVKTLGEMPR